MGPILFLVRDLVTAWLLSRTWSSSLPAESVLLPTDRLEDVPKTLRAYVIGGKSDRTPISRATISVVCEICIFVHRRMDLSAPGDGRAEAALLEEIASASDKLDLFDADGKKYSVLSATIDTTADPDQFYKGILAGSVTLRIEHHLERN
jgi:hypothetical protein